MNGKYTQLQKYIDNLEHKNEDSLIKTLQKAQDLYGYLSEDIQRYIAKQLSISAVKVYGVVTFYSLFRTQKKGDTQISVCTGTACFIKGADTVTEEFKKALNIGDNNISENRKISIDCIRCIGACGLAPVVTVGEKVYSKVSPKDVREIVDEIM